LRLLVFNAGSSSLKFELIEFVATLGRRIAAGSFADSDGSGLFRWSGESCAPEAGGRDGGGRDSTGSAGAPHETARTLAQAAGNALDWLSNGSVHGRNLLEGLDATAHRIVHGGAEFRQTTLLRDTELAALGELTSLAPLHNPPALAVIEAVRRRLGADRPLVGVFDTAYYSDLPPAAYRYAVPERWAREHGIRRYGFHGIAHRYLCERARALHGDPLEELRGAAVRRKAPLRIISLQLGRGCSVTATRGRSAVATSMGFTPLEGLVMGTRSGDVDPGAVLFVMERTGMSADAVRRTLNEQSGLLALSGRTSDMRQLLELERMGDTEAALAIECFCRRARHYLGAHLAELGGADAIVFGGGIGENCADIRRRIVGCLEWAGIRLQPAANAAAVGAETKVHDPASAAAVYVVPVNEAQVIAAEAASLLA
jgi:acetate kinase